MISYIIQCVQEHCGVVSLMMFQSCFGGYFNFQPKVKDTLRVFLGCFKSVSTVLHRRLKDDLGCLKILEPI